MSLQTAHKNWNNVQIHTEFSGTLMAEFAASSIGEHLRLHGAHPLSFQMMSSADNNRTCQRFAQSNCRQLSCGQHRVMEAINSRTYVAYDPLLPATYVCVVASAVQQARSTYVHEMINLRLTDLPIHSLEKYIRTGRELALGYVKLDCGIEHFKIILSGTCFFFSYVSVCAILLPD